jgi:DNA polymerase phi
LVELIGTSPGERQLSEKAKGVLSNRIGKSRHFPLTSDVVQINHVLNALHVHARKARSTNVLPTISQCSLYLSKLLLQSQSVELVHQVYRDSLVDFFTRKGSGLNTAFFHDFFRRYPTSAWALRDTLINVSGKAVNAYRQCQAFQLLQVLVSQLPVLVSLSSHA